MVLDPFLPGAFSAKMRKNSAEAAGPIPPRIPSFFDGLSRSYDSALLHTFLTFYIEIAARDIYNNDLSPALLMAASPALVVIKLVPLPTTNPLYMDRLAVNEAHDRLLGIKVNNSDIRIHSQAQMSFCFSSREYLLDLGSSLPRTLAN